MPCMVVNFLQFLVPVLQPAVHSCRSLIFNKFYIWEKWIGILIQIKAFRICSHIEHYGTPWNMKKITSCLLLSSELARAPTPPHHSPVLANIGKPLLAHERLKREKEPYYRCVSWRRGGGVVCSAAIVCSSCGLKHLYLEIRHHSDHNNRSRVVLYRLVNPVVASAPSVIHSSVSLGSFWLSHLLSWLHCNPFSSQLVFNLTLAPSWV